MAKAEKSEKAEKKEMKLVINKGQRTFITKDGRFAPGEHEVSPAVAAKLKKEYPREFKIVGEK